MGYPRRTALRSSPGRRRLSTCAGKLSQRKTRGYRGLSVVAEQHGISLEDARALFSKRFCKGSGVHLELETPTGRGLVAAAPVAPGDVLITVPWREAIHVLEDGVLRRRRPAPGAGAAARAGRRRRGRVHRRRVRRQGQELEEVPPHAAGIHRGGRVLVRR